MSLLIETKNATKDFSLNLPKPYFEAKILTQEEIIQKSSQNLFKPVSTLQRYDPGVLLKQVWQQQELFQEVESDYQSPAFYEKKSFKESKTVHLVVPLLEDEKDSIFPILHSSLLVLAKNGAEKIVLQIICDRSISTIWADFWQTYSADLELLKAKIFLGSLGDEEYAFSKDITKTCLAARVMLNPVLSEEGGEYQSIDQYLKLKFEARYYENYDIYTQDQLAFFPHEIDISKQISKAQELNPNRGIFPLDNTSHSFERNDQVWILDFKPERLAKLLEIIIELNEVFGLNQTIFSNLDYQIGRENSIEDFQVNSTPEYYPIFDSLSTHFWKKDFVELVFTPQEEIAPEIEFERFLRKNADLFNESNKQKWLRLDMRDFWNIQELAKILDKFIYEIAINQSLILLDQENAKMKGFLRGSNHVENSLLSLDSYSEKISKEQKNFISKELKLELGKLDSKIPLFCGLFLLK
jgi:hypothetical protein